MSVMQSASSYDVLPTMSYLSHLASWYLGVQARPRTDRVLRTALRAGLASVGLIDPPSS